MQKIIIHSKNNKMLDIEINLFCLLTLFPKKLAIEINNLGII